MIADEMSIYDNILTIYSKLLRLDYFVVFRFFFFLDSIFERSRKWLALKLYLRYMDLFYINLGKIHSEMCRHRRDNSVVDITLLRYAMLD